MKKMLVVLILLVASTVYGAVDVTVTFSDAQYARLVKTAQWKSKTIPSLIREATVEKLEYEKYMRREQVLQQNWSSICASHDC